MPVRQVVGLAGLAGTGVNNAEGCGGVNNEGGCGGVGRAYTGLGEETTVLNRGEC